MYQRLAHRSAWAGYEGKLPVIEGTLIRIRVDHLPGRGRGPGLAVVVAPASPGRK